MKWLSLSFLLLLAASCHKVNGLPDTSGSEIFPNQIGDRWVYLVHDTVMQSGNPVASEYNLSVWVAGSLNLPGGISAKIWIYSAPQYSDTNYVYSAADTVKFLDKTKTYLLRQYIIPFSLKSSWPYVPGNFTDTVQAMGDVNVQGHVFSGAFLFQGKAGGPDNTFYVSEWHAPYIGLVSRYFNPYGELILNKHTRAWALVSYQLK